MSDSMEMKKFMAAEIAAGKSLSDIQTLLNEKFGVRLTYMDVRIMASELDNIDWTSRDPVKPADPVEDVTKVPVQKKDAAGNGTTVVEVNQVVRAGALAEGTVQFGSGASGTWIVDQMGRLGFDKLNGEPTEKDIQEFQMELRKVLR
ncbi:MAG: hypothetical protein IJC34_00655 [Lentisphaeria bacterium]|nr:hypothetical protein [Lentisphaeria bacterium]